MSKQKEDLEDADAWFLNDLFQKEFGCVDHQIRSFDHFMDRILKPTIESIDFQVFCEDRFSIHKNSLHSISFENVRYTYPRSSEQTSIVTENRQIFREEKIHLLTPQTARHQMLTYSIDVLVDVRYKIYHRIPKEEEEDRNLDLSQRKNWTEDSLSLADTFSYETVRFIEIPIMVKSKYCVANDHDGMADPSKLKECYNDPGGYFIIKGNEQVIVSQEQMKTNEIYVFKKSGASKSQNQSLLALSAHGDESYYLRAEVRCLEEKSYRSPLLVALKYVHSKGLSVPSFKVCLPYIQEEIPLGILMKALGIVSDAEIAFYLTLGRKRYQKFIVSTLEEAYPIRTREDALSFVGVRGTNKDLDEEATLYYGQEFVLRDFLCHIPKGRDKEKALFMGEMVGRLLDVYQGMRRADDRDRYENKQIHTAGTLLGSLCTRLIKKHVKVMKMTLKKWLNEGRNINLLNIINGKKITQGIRYSINTGNWAPKGYFGLSGVSAMLQRSMNNLITISHLGRVVTPLGREGKQTKPRQLMTDQFGTVCCSDSPEGPPCGLLKNFALTKYVSLGSESSLMDRVLLDLGAVTVDRCTPQQISSFWTVSVNGRNQGFVEDGVKLFRELKILKRSFAISFETGIVKDVYRRCVKVRTDHGRPMRPFLVVDPETNATLLTKTRLLQFQKYLPGGSSTDNWFRLCMEGYIEYLDVEEFGSAMICISLNNLRSRSIGSDLFVRYEYCEIHPINMMGYNASIIPFGTHNPSPRMAYQCAMGKQAVGIPYMNFDERFDIMAHVLHYPQKPIVQTKTSDYVHQNEMPTGQNVVVAILAQDGYTMEDAVEINKSAIDRGLFRSTYYRTFMTKENISLEERIGPYDKQKTSASQSKNFSKLDEDGIVAVGTRIASGDVLVSKYSPYRNSYGSNEKYERKDCSLINKGLEGIVDRVMITEVSETISNHIRGSKLVKVRIRTQKVPRIGDKFSSRHGQKGVAGMIRDQADMPFTRDGMVPDIIINPHSLPSRLTFGQLFEMLLGKISAVEGSIGDGTIFDNLKNVTMEDMKKKIHSLGYPKTCGECMYKGTTGERIEGVVMLGIAYYQRLKHMVDDKINARGRTGPRYILTRQPIEGRGEGGGLRFGEMERDVLVAYGAAMLLKERLSTLSDETPFVLCQRCGLFGYYQSKCLEDSFYPDLDKSEKRCHQCKDRGILKTVRLPYAFKLLHQELLSTNTVMRLRVGKCKE